MNNPTSKARVLIAEDEQIAAIDLERSLQRLSYDVTKRVTSGEEAMKQCALLKPDIALLDIMLEGEHDGIAVAAHIRDQFDIPVVFLTSHADEHTLQRAKVTEPAGFLLKPFNEAELHATLQMALYRKNTSQHSKTLQPDTTSDAAVDIPNFLRTHTFFSSLSEQEIELLAGACRVQEFDGGEDVARAGKDHSNPFIVMEGRISLLSSPIHGKELTVEIQPAGDMLGLISALEPPTPIPFTARAQIPSKVLWIPQSTFLLLLDSHPMLSRRFTEYIVSRLRGSHLLAQALAHSPVVKRVAMALVSLIPKHVDTETQDEISIEITRQELAEITGSVAETVVRAVKSFEREGVLRLGQRRKITVCNLPQLEKIAAE